MTIHLDLKLTRCCLVRSKYEDGSSFFEPNYTGNYWILYTDTLIDSRKKAKKPKASDGLLKYKTLRRVLIESSPFVLEQINEQKIKEWENKVKEFCKEIDFKSLPTIEKLPIHYTVEL